MHFLSLTECSSSKRVMGGAKLDGRTKIKFWKVAYSFYYCWHLRSLLPKKGCVVSWNCRIDVIVMSWCQWEYRRMTSTGTQFGAISIFHGFVVFNPRFFVLPSLAIACWQAGRDLMRREDIWILWILGEGVRPPNVGPTPTRWHQRKRVTNV